MANLKRVNDKIRFGKRGGTVVGHTTFKRYGWAEEVETYYIVQLDPESQGYMEPIGAENPHDTFISLMLIHIGSEDD